MKVTLGPSQWGYSSIDEALIKEREKQPQYICKDEKEMLELELEWKKLTRVGVTSKTYNFGAQGYGVFNPREKREAREKREQP